MTKVLLNIPDSLDPATADAKYTEPLRRLLAERGFGRIVAVEQGEWRTPDEFSRFISIDLPDDQGIDLILEFLVNAEAPPGTLTQTFDLNGEVRDNFMLMPPRDGEPQ